MPRRAFDPTRLSDSTPPEIDFLAALSHAQGKRETDRAFAHRLRVSLELWRHTRAGRRTLNWKLLMAGRDLVSHRIFEAALESVAA